MKDCEAKLIGGFLERSSLLGVINMSPLMRTETTVQSSFNVYKSFFQSIKHPMFIIDMCHNHIKSKEKVINPATAELIECCEKNLH
jgi:hypothetical protein